MGLSANSIARLRSQMARAEIILFTGAGFSVGASNRQGQRLPTTAQLKEELWELCYPDKTHDLALATARRFPLNRAPIPISATSQDRSYVPSSRQGAPHLEVVHLNGALPDPPESLTFSETQYAERIANKEPWYARCVADLVSRPAIFVGTDLREVPLWQHMQLRKLSTPPRNDRRAGSILVTPTLSPSRHELLQELRVEWFQGTAESFAEEVLAQLEDAGGKGFVFLGEYSRSLGRRTLQLASDLAAEHPSLETGYLSGEEPHWSDILTGRAVERAYDIALYRAAVEIFKGTRSCIPLFFFVSNIKLHRRPLDTPAVPGASLERLHQRTNPVIGPIGKMVIQHQPLPKQRMRPPLHGVRLQPAVIADALARCTQQRQHRDRQCTDQQQPVPRSGRETCIDDRPIPKRMSLMSRKPASIP